MTLDTLAQDYVRLVLEIDAHESGYVDAYFGPDDWREAARRNPRERPELKRDADRIKAALPAFVATGGEQGQRARVLLADVSSARFRLDMIDGKRVSFADEAERLFALRPELKPLASFEDALARIEALIPGTAPLSERVEIFRSRYSVPDDRVQVVMEAAIAECRRRTSAFIPLPPGESFSMELVKGQAWGAYNYYLGGDRSLIQINTDAPVSIGNALILGCHEGYPGHHVQGIYNERNYRDRGWAEYSVAPLYAPAAPLNEGGADFGVELAFPEDERLKFEMDVLYPLAGLDPEMAPAFDVLRRATAELDGALLKVSQMQLDGEIDRDEAITLVQKYRLASRDVAAQSLEFDRKYRAYVINYSVGEALVRGYVDRHGHDAASRWAAYVHIISEPTLPADLRD
ncbi:MAG: hypothetical protein ABMA14_06090 [Hyphomonadaceae bacterium]